MKAGERHVLTLEHVDLEGRGVGRLEGREVLVAGAFGGERAHVELEHVSRGGPIAHARLRELVQAHPSRRALPCARHEDAGGRCGGCALMALDEPAQREQKRAMLAALGLAVDAWRAGEPLASDGRALGYRVSAKRVAFGGAGRLTLGSFARGSHRPADMAGCLVDHPAIAGVADLLAERARACSLAAWDERRGEGALRAVWLRLVDVDAYEDPRARVLVTLVLGPGVAPGVVSALAAELAGDERVAAIACSEGREGNDLRGAAPTVLHAGEVDAAAWLTFVQPNAPLAARIYDDLLSDESGAPLEGARAYDLYAGTGATTSRLRARFGEVLACESYPESAAALGVPPRRAEAFLAAREPGPLDLVVANPPRKGLGAEVVQELARLMPARVHVMSCGPKSLARDLEGLRGAGYELARLHAWDTLPQTPHVELVAKLRRARSPHG
ncbi:MAG: class I SAM-dependent RNA methyltransferase [Myxococcales bacterium]|nr:class I SAM-dependent RNA methyltransferase [Myxococcales bacterium]